MRAGVKACPGGVLGHYNRGLAHADATTARLSGSGWTKGLGPSAGPSNGENPPLAASALPTPTS